MRVCVRERERMCACPCTLVYGRVMCVCKCVEHIYAYVLSVILRRKNASSVSNITGISLALSLSCCQSLSLWLPACLPGCLCVLVHWIGGVVVRTLGMG